MLLDGLQTIGLPNCSALPEANGGEAPECFIPFNSTLTELPPGSPKSKYTVCVLVSYNYIVIQPVCVCLCMRMHCMCARTLRVCVCVCVLHVCVCACVCICACVSAWVCTILATYLHYTHIPNCVSKVCHFSYDCAEYNGTILSEFFGEYQC